MVSDIRKGRQKFNFTLVTISLPGEEKTRKIRKRR